MEIDSDEHKLYVSHHASPNVSVINLMTNSIEKQIQLKGPTHALVLDKKSGLLHVTYLPTSGVTGQAFLNRVEFIDTKTNTLVSGIDIPANPFVMKIDENQQLFASVINDSIVFVVDLPEHTGYQEVVATAEEAEAQPVDEKGGCLIATATFGSELVPQVQLLREIRDNTVLSTASGASFMTAFNSFYYSFSPTIADLERQNPMFKETVKVAITPLLSSLSLLQYVDIDSEAEMLGYGIGIILLNIGIYFLTPAILILKLKPVLQTN